MGELHEDGEVLDLDPGETETEEAGQEGQGGEGAEQQEAEASDDGFLTFDEGDDAERPEDSSTMRELRAKLREEQRRRHELEKQIAPKDDDIGPKPTLESCGYDEGLFEQELDAWKDKNGAKARKAEDARKAQEAQQQEWAGHVQTFDAKVKELKIPDFEDAVAEVLGHFGEGIGADTLKHAIVKSQDPRMVVALKNSPAALARLVALKNDPIGLAMAIGELKGKARVARRNAPPPENLARGSAPKAAAGDKELERLEKEADRTGDRSKVIAYRREQRRKAEAE